MTTPLEALRKARALLENPEHWTTGAFARDINGDMVTPSSGYAVAWCAEGALLVGSIYNQGAFKCLAEACTPTPEGGIPEYNDDLTDHPALLAWFDRAIKLAEAP